MANRQFIACFSSIPIISIIHALAADTIPLMQLDVGHLVISRNYLQYLPNFTLHVDYPVMYVVKDFKYILQPMNTRETNLNMKCYSTSIQCKPVTITRL